MGGFKVKDEIARKLHGLFDEDEKAQQKSAERATEQQNAEEKNLTDFKRIRDAIIRPALQEIADVYISRKAYARIQETEEGDNSSTGSKDATITLDLAGPGYRDRTMRPGFRFYFDKRRRSLLLHTTTSSMSGPAGDIALDAVTTDWIHEAFLKYRSKG
jgi:hypothetical protein